MCCYNKIFIAFIWLDSAAHAHFIEMTHFGTGCEKVSQN